jgi:hypothetical protein
MATFSQAYYARWAAAAPKLPIHKLNLYAVASREERMSVESS